MTKKWRKKKRKRNVREVILFKKQLLKFNFFFLDDEKVMKELQEADQQFSTEVRDIQLHRTKFVTSVRQMGRRQTKQKLLISLKKAKNNRLIREDGKL